MKKMLFFIVVVAMMVSCKDGVLVNKLDKNVNVAVGVKAKISMLSDKAVLAIGAMEYNLIMVEGGPSRWGRRMVAELMKRRCIA